MLEATDSVTLGPGPSCNRCETTRLGDHRCDASPDTCGVRADLPAARSGFSLSGDARGVARADRYG